MARRKAQRDQVGYKPRDPAAPCKSCDSPKWFRTLPRGEWRCPVCNPYGLLDAQRSGKWETFTVRTWIAPAG